MKIKNIMKYASLAGMLSLAPVQLHSEKGPLDEWYKNFEKQREYGGEATVMDVDEESMSVDEHLGTSQHYEFVRLASLKFEPLSSDGKSGYMRTVENNYIIFSSTPLSKGDVIRFHYIPKKQINKEDVSQFIQKNVIERVDINGIEGVIDSYNIIKLGSKR